jgi:hypothetical protein
MATNDSSFSKKLNLSSSDSSTRRSSTYSTTSTLPSYEESTKTASPDKTVRKQSSLKLKALHNEAVISYLALR